jgi:hypothetical protein
MTESVQNWLSECKVLSRMCLPDLPQLSLTSYSFLSNRVDLYMM